MPKSMTGFGRGASTAKSGRELTVEIRSVNHRYCDVRVAASPELNRWTTEIEKLLRKRFARGRLDVQVGWAIDRSARSTPVIDVELARAYQSAFRELARELGLEEDVSLRTVLEAPGVLSSPVRSEDEESTQAAILRAVEDATSELESMRSTEGTHLAAAVEAHLHRVGELVEDVQRRSPEVVVERRRRLEVRLTELLADVSIDPPRIGQEVALMADRMDVSEELERLHGHAEHVASLLRADEPVGRKLDFLVQEMNREVNTIGSKCSDGGVAQLVVELKAELERMREQIQNLE